MVVKPFVNEYDKEIYDYIKESTHYDDLCEGEKSILYDLVHEVVKATGANLSMISIPDFVHKCYLGYTKNKSTITLQVIANCIDYCFPNKIARIVDIGNGHKQLIVRDKYLM